MEQHVPTSAAMCELVVLAIDHACARRQRYATVSSPYTKTLTTICSISHNMFSIVFIDGVRFSTSSYSIWSCLIFLSSLILCQTSGISVLLSANWSISVLWSLRALDRNNMVKIVLVSNSPPNMKSGNSSLCWIIA